MAAAAQRGTLLDAARAADTALREAEARRAPVTELHRLAKELDATLTAAMRATYAAQRAEIGARGYEDRIFTRKAKAKPAVRALTAEAERLLTLRENHRMNHIPEVPRQPAV
jgi:epoxyqueuosine reductase QueG